jgi:hypothetical protein
LNRVTKYVISSTMTEPDWQNSVILAGDPGRRVPHVRLPGGSGRGRRFFPDGYSADLTLVHARTFGNGVTHTCYRPN